MSNHQQIASLFDDWATTGKADGLEESHGDVARQVLAQIEIRAGMQSLDLGCGTGWATRILAAAAPGAGAVGIDVSPAMIRRAEDLHDLTSRARYEVGTFEELGFPDGRFDRVFSMEALYYAVNLDASLAEMLRVLKPGGTADVVIDRFRESIHTEDWSEKIGLEMNFSSQAEWAAAFKRTGFKEVRTSRVIDSRGPGNEADFTPGAHFPDFATLVELHEAGSLWIHAEKPG